MNFSFVNSSEFHACISYMGRYPFMCWGGTMRVHEPWKRISNNFLHVADIVFVTFINSRNISSACIFFVHDGNLTICQEKASAKIPWEILPGKKSRWILGDFSVEFWGLFPWKNSGKNPPQNPQQNSNQNFGASRPKSTLQGSALDKSGDCYLGNGNGDFQINNLDHLLSGNGNGNFQRKKQSVTFLAGHGKICPPHGWSTWRPADQPTTRPSTWTLCLFKENHTRNPCGSASCGLVCGPMWGANFAMAR